MQEHSLSGKVISRLSDHVTKTFADRAAWTAHLETLGITTLAVHPDPVRIASEGALWGSIAAQGLLDDTVIVSDGAGQFDIGLHAACWVHAERLVHKLDAFTDDRRAAKEAIRDRIWQLYADLKTYACAQQSGEKLAPAAKTELATRFDAIFTTKTCFVTLNRLLKRLHAKKADLLMVLERPSTPLHDLRLGARHPVPRHSGSKVSLLARARTRGATAATPSSAC